MNGNQVKILAMAAMLVDHCAYAFVPAGTPLRMLMRFLGRLTGPLMAWQLAEGYQRSRNVRRYAARLAVFALISWIPYCLFAFGRWPMSYQSVIYTLLLGLLAILIDDRSGWGEWQKRLAIIGLCLLSLPGDWAVFDVLWPLFFFRDRNDEKQSLRDYCVIAAVVVAMQVASGGLREIYSLGVFLVPLVLRYGWNGKAGPRSGFLKWFGYVFYPLHMLVLFLIRSYLM